MLKQLEDLRDRLPAACDRAVRETCERIREDAQGLCPVRTGALRQSIAASAEAGEDGASGTVRAGAPYAGTVELGTLGQAAKPFLHPAFAARADGLAPLVWDAWQGGTT